MSVYTFHQRVSWNDLGREKVIVDLARSSLDDEYRQMMRRTKAGYWSRPTRLGDWRPRGELVVEKALRWPDVLENLDEFGYVVSQRVVHLLQDVPRSQLECYPIRIRSPRRSPQSPAYFLMNFCRAVDALNLTATQVEVSTTEPDLEHLHFVDRGPAMEYVVDPDRLAVGVQAFVLQRLQTPCVSAELADRLRRARLVDLDIQPLRNRREPEAHRRATLDELRRQVRRARARLAKPVSTVREVSGLERALGIKVPSRVRAFWRNRENLIYKWGEVYDVGRAVSETETLRQWKQLNWPHELVVVSDDGRGGYFALDLRGAPREDSPVVYFDHELGVVDKQTGSITPTLERAAPTFDAWIQRLARGGTGEPRHR